MRRAVVICGSKIEDYDFIKSYLRIDDYFICCDSGLSHIKKLGINNPDLIIGDFDSHEQPDMDDFPAGEMIVLPRAKDDTDSVYAVKEAVKRDFDEILMIGALGKRIDHGLVNIHILLYLFERGIDAMIVDDYSEMELIGVRNKDASSDKNGEETIAAASAEVTNEWEYFSLIALDGDAKGVTIKGAKFNLDNAAIPSDYQYATSNEVAGDGPAEISVKEGKLLLVRVRPGC